ncbi:hypothetical protein CGRA01v4_14645 [Colletotrichum graminicola]|nr:hypothetical protein CGRA01v4_14645 [Colletotrichum graminicola]
MYHAWDGKLDKTVPSVLSTYEEDVGGDSRGSTNGSGLSLLLDGIACFVRVYADGPGWLIEALLACHHACPCWSTESSAALMVQGIMAELGKRKRRLTSDDTTWACLAAWDTPAGMCLLRPRGWQILSDPISTARCQFATIRLIQEGGDRPRDTSMPKVGDQGLAGITASVPCVVLHDTWCLRRWALELTLLGEFRALGYPVHPYEGTHGRLRVCAVRMRLKNNNDDKWL